jgi:hypothetical protein
MKKLILIALLLSTNAFAATAYHTGRSYPITTVTGMAGMKCEYMYGGQRFWYVFGGLCPMSIEVE